MRANDRLERPDARDPMAGAWFDAVACTQGRGSLRLGGSRALLKREAPISAHHRPRCAPTFINGKFCGQRVTGVQRYACGLLAALDAHLAAGSKTNWTLL